MEDLDADVNEVDFLSRYLQGFHSQETGNWRQEEVMAQEAQVNSLPFVFYFLGIL
jgi:hypothetical protein